jgi:hypothetical protein
MALILADVVRYPIHPEAGFVLQLAAGRQSGLFHGLVVYDASNYSSRTWEMMVAAACHIHSEWSYDAKWSLRDLAAEFARRGYRVLLVAEHDRNFSELRFQQHRSACADASSGDLLVVPGIEYSDAGNLIHVLTWGMASFIGEGLPTGQLLAEVRANNGVAVLAHPARRKAWLSYDCSWSTYLVGIEIWNRKYDGWAPSPVATTLLRGTDLVPFASLDFHERNQLFPLSMQLDISGPITEDSVVNCIRARRCRATAFSQPAEKFLTGSQRFIFPPMEKIRRSAASVYRSIKRFGQRC